MTTIVVDLKCPACGHLMGEEEYKHVSENFDRVAEEKSNRLIEKTRYECDKELQDMKDQYYHNFENEVLQRVVSQTKEIEAENDEEMKERERRHKEELAHKDNEIKEAKLQKTSDIEEKIKQALNDYEEKHEAKYKQKDPEGELQLRRIKDENRNLLNQVEKLQKTLDSVPPEVMGTAGEILLLDNLHNAFPKDELVPKIVGVEMADVIQTIVIENGEKIAPPIVWDRKMGDRVTSADIIKAKKYKTAHNTDFSIIVTEKGITKKDSDNTLIGTREGILLVHPAMVVEIAKLLRSFIIESAKQTNGNQGRTSKQAKLYDHLASSEYARTIKTIRDAKSNLDDLQRKEEDHHRTTWNTRRKFIDEWFEISERNQQVISDIIQDQTSQHSKDDFIKKEEG